MICNGNKNSYRDGTSAFFWCFFFQKRPAFWCCWVIDTLYLWVLHKQLPCLLLLFFIILFLWLHASYWLESQLMRKNLTHPWVEADSLFVITSWKLRHAWPHRLEVTNYIYCYYGCIVTCKNSTSYLNSFLRYCSLKNSIFWLVQRFLDLNSKIRFFSKVFCRKLENDWYFHIKLKRYILLKKPHFCPFLYTFCRKCYELSVALYWYIFVRFWMV